MTAQVLTRRESRSFNARRCPARAVTYLRQTLKLTAFEARPCARRASTRYVRPRSGFRPSAAAQWEFKQPREHVRGCSRRFESHVRSSAPGSELDTPPVTCLGHALSFAGSRDCSAD